MRRRSYQNLRALLALAGFFVPCVNGMAMTLEQMQKLPLVALLNERMDSVFSRCGFPAAIEDLGAGTASKRQFVWRNTPLSLSAGEWSVTYWSIADNARPHGTAPAPTGQTTACLRGASRVVLLAREVGIIVRTKKPTEYGYITRYQIPPDPLQAHKVLRVDVSLEPTLPLEDVRKSFGEPDETLASRPDASVMRYWVVVRDNIHSPRSAFAVDFKIDASTKRCVRFSVDTDSIEFVAKRLEQLQAHWERAFVLD